MRQPEGHFTPHAEGSRDLRLALAWIAATLIAGVAANVFVMVLRAAQ